jgi:beta-glucanase (GH16 family)
MFNQEFITKGGGILTITAKKQRNGANAYTSSRMTTQGKHEFTYGRIEARLAVPKGKGLWPAFWMIGSNIGSVGWPKCGEIDIMEHINTNDTCLSLLF